MKEQTQKIVILSSLVFLINCSKNFGADVTAEYSSANEQSFGVSPYNMNLHPVVNNICDPFGGGAGGNPQHGIKAALYYRGATQPGFTSARDYVNHAMASKQSLFLSDLYVPTRIFDQGFATQTSSVIKNDTGEMLIEYFGLKLDWNFRLNETDENGSYEFAALGDDGIILRAQISENSIGQTLNPNSPDTHELIVNDGVHPTSMGCSSTLISLNQNSRLPMQMLYYQGPRYHIANVLMYRKSNPSLVGQDPLCQQGGNEFFFDPNSGSSPTVNYAALLARGWMPVVADHFYVPFEEEYNPCTEATPPIISQFQVSEVLSHDAYFTWTTDVPSTSQVILSDPLTHEEIIPATDNVLRTHHVVHVSGLAAATNYEAKAVSVTSDLGKAISPAIALRTEP